MDKSFDKKFEHAWKYFEIHANQRMQMFNYYIAISAGITAGLATSFQVGNQLSFLGFVAGILLVLVSFVFWKLDSRTSFFIKHAEVSLKTLELEFNINQFHIFTNEEQHTEYEKASNKCIIFSSWSYSKSFQFMFLILGFIGLIGAIVSAKIYLKV